jgi:excisionase family DNA binding protein
MDMERNHESRAFLTVDEAAQLVGLSHWTMRSWIQKGHLTRYKSAARTVVSRDELLERVKPALAASHRVAAPASVGA